MLQIPQPEKSVIAWGVLFRLRMLSNPPQGKVTIAVDALPLQRRR